MGYNTITHLAGTISLVCVLVPAICWVWKMFVGFYFGANVEYLARRVEYVRIRNQTGVVRIQSDTLLRIHSNIVESLSSQWLKKGEIMAHFKGL